MHTSTVLETEKQKQPCNSNKGLTNHTQRNQKATQPILLLTHNGKVIKRNVAQKKRSKRAKKEK